ncbi:aromatic ring-hydroxylating dioxygenase subunit alpha [Micromonospora sp. WMMD714]|uniref:aromatic ring-hydroxylating oxygenase subunit alpha n=1 Tax=Micromonospora sp. WMMD714 TaxID=3016097 RepID=UPI00249CB886|nr:aromatic ring-hydroxylating dioxygenase subunit alpha [Micromonospora sp. WMMD714]WFE63000.1 aromatic ring-hydroxylating dioxygenase subunit alpha [Micromonospora sp. WMMD714]
MSPTETARVTPSPDRTAAELVAELRDYLRPDPPTLSLPPQLFTSPEVYEWERSRIFHRSWILVGHVDQLAEPGDYLAMTIAGEPVAVTRDQDGVLHGLSPVCRHRMMPLVEPGAGNTRDLTCSYHLWRYNLDGTLLAATHMRGNADFDPAACRLPTFAVTQWHGLVFVNLDAGAPAFDDDLSVVDREMTNYRLDEMVQVSSWTEEWDCNWKIAVENGHENYHAIGFHPETVRPLMTGGIDMAVHADSALVTRLLSPTGTPFETSFLTLTEAERSVMYSFRLFPCAAVATFGESIAWISLVPVSIGRTQVRGGTLMPAAALEGADLAAVRAQIEAVTGVINAEDRRGLEAVQSAVGSRFLRRGQLSPKEPGVLAFYRNLALAMTADTPGT